VRSKQPEFQSERVMGEVCLGVAVAGVETLIVMAIAILLMLKDGLSWSLS
jgi:hypothetical protein